MSEPVILDMTPDGGFTDPPPPGLLVRALRVVVALAVLVGVLFVVAVALWFALLLVPIAIGVAVVAWFVRSNRSSART